MTLLVAPCTHHFLICLCIRETTFRHQRYMMTIDDSHSLISNALTAVHADD